MLYTQWNWDDAMDVEREEAYEEGVQAGIAERKNLGEFYHSHQFILDLLEDLGDIPEDIQAYIHAEEDTQILCQWHKAVSKVESFDAFRKKWQGDNRKVSALPGFLQLIDGFRCSGRLCESM